MSTLWDDEDSVTVKGSDIRKRKVLMQTLTADSTSTSRLGEEWSKVTTLKIPCFVYDQ